MDYLNQLSQNLFVPGVDLGEKVLRALLVYFFLMVMIRVFGRRFVGQMNTLDFVVLLVLSNTVQNAIIGNDNSLLGGIVGAVTLIVANYILDRLAFRSRLLRHLLEGEPVYLVRDGKPNLHNLRKSAITSGELLALVRIHGIRTVAECESVILEANGAVSVVAFPHTDDAIAELGRTLDSLKRDLRPQPEGA